MYSMDPLYKLPNMIASTNSMYSMKPIIGGNVSPVSANVASSSKEQLQKFDQATASKENPAIEEQFNILVSDQGKLLTDLKGFQDELCEQMNAVSTTEKSSSSWVDVVKPKKSEPVLDDVVINSNPQRPPYCLIAMLRLWNDVLKLKVSTYVHSSATELAKSVQGCTDELKTHSIEDHKLHVLFMWKNVESECQLIMSASNSKPVYGEVNILRFFIRLLLPSSDIVAETVCDDLLDTVHRLNYTDDEEREDLIQTLNNSINDGEWFSKSEKIGVADIALWSAIISIGIDHIPANSRLEKWFENCNLAIGTPKFIYDKIQKSET